MICIPDPTSLPLLLHPFARASPASIVDLEGFDQGSAEILKWPPDLNFVHAIIDIILSYSPDFIIPLLLEDSAKGREWIQATT